MLLSTYQQSVPLPGLLAADVYTGTAPDFKHQGQFLQPDTSALLTAGPFTTQKFLGGSPPQGIFDDNIITDADLALLQSLLDQHYDPSSNSPPAIIPDDTALGFDLTPHYISAPQNANLDSSPAVPSYLASAATSATESPPSSIRSSAASSPTDSASSSSKLGSYKCSYEGCRSKKTWDTVGDLKRHQRYHDKKPHKCTTPGCGWAFTNKSDLHQHINTHSENETMFPCLFPECREEYNRKDNMLKHHWKKHGENASKRGQRRGSRS